MQFCKSFLIHKHSQEVWRYPKATATFSSDVLVDLLVQLLDVVLVVGLTQRLIAG